MKIKNIVKGALFVTCFSVVGLASSAADACTVVGTNASGGDLCYTVEPDTSLSPVPKCSDFTIVRGVNKYKGEVAMDLTPLPYVPHPSGYYPEVLPCPPTPPTPSPKN